MRLNFRAKRVIIVSRADLPVWVVGLFRFPTPVFGGPHDGTRLFGCCSGQVRGGAAELASALVDRDEEIDLALTALVAQEHLLLVGPPGCGKSLLLDSLLAWAGGREILGLVDSVQRTRRTFRPGEPGRLEGGPVRAGHLWQTTRGRLRVPRRRSSRVARPSSIHLLKVLNERLFDRGDGEARPVPLKLWVAAANDGLRRRPPRNLPPCSIVSSCGKQWPPYARRMADEGCSGRQTMRQSFPRTWNQATWPRRAVKQRRWSGPLKGEKLWRRSCANWSRKGCNQAIAAR